MCWKFMKYKSQAHVYPYEKYEGKVSVNVKSVAICFALLKLRLEVHVILRFLQSFKPQEFQVQ